MHGGFDAIRRHIHAVHSWCGRTGSRRGTWAPINGGIGLVDRRLRASGGLIHSGSVVPRTDLAVHVDVLPHTN